MSVLKIFTASVGAIMLALSLDACAVQGNKHAPQELENAMVKQVIEQQIRRYQVALNNANTNEVLELYSDTPVFMPQHSVAQIGREQVRAAYQRVFKSIDLDIVFSIEEIDYFSDLAYARTRSAGKVRILANNHTVNEANNELFIFHKEKGQWKIHRYLFSTTNPRQ